MKVKVQCACETRFEFEVEPVNERMPVPISCPGCGIDATELANAVIKRQSSVPQAGLVIPAPRAITVAAVVAPSGQPAPVAIPTARAAPVATPVVAPASSVAPAPQAAPAPRAVPAPSAAPGPRIVMTSGAKPPAAATAAPAAVAPTSLKISMPAPAHAPATRMHVATPGHPSAPADDAEAAGQFCNRHDTEPAAEVCCVCGKPICLSCMEQFGYLCSVYCREQARHKRMYVPAYAGQKSTIEAKRNSKAKLAVYAVAALVTLAIGSWFWYEYMARNPKEVYSASLAKVIGNLGQALEGNERYELIAPNQLAAVKNKKLSLLQLQPQKELWTARLQSESEEAAVKDASAKNEDIKKRTPRRFDSDSREEITRYVGLSPLPAEDEFRFSSPKIIATTNDLWVLLGDRLERFDRLTGNPKELKIEDQILHIMPAETGILVISGSPGGNKVLNRITLPDGALQSEVIGSIPKPLTAPASALTRSSSGRNNSANPNPAAGALAADGGAAAGMRNAMAPAAGRRSGGRGGRGAATDMTTPPATGAARSAMTMAKSVADQPASAPPDDASADDMSDDMFSGMFDSSGQSFIETGANVVEFQARILEEKTVSRQAMKTPAGTSLLESKNLNASQGVDVAQEMLNGMQRSDTGGLEFEDVSRYEVTLHRRFAKDVPDWKGEVISRPEFIPLKTVDLVVAGSNLLVFDKSNKKLWEARLAFRAAASYSPDGEHMPCLETKDALYFADKGMLTRFDLLTGNVRWRLNSVNISDVQTDDKGGLYLDTTTAAPDSIKYSQDINLRDKTVAVVMKVDPEKGAILWHSDFPSLRYHLMMSGKFLYSTRNWDTQDPTRLEEGPDHHFNFKLLKSGSGNLVWNYPRLNNTPRHIEVQQNWILLQSVDRAVVLHFFSL